MVCGYIAAALGFAPAESAVLLLRWSQAPPGRLQVCPRPCSSPSSPSLTAALRLRGGLVKRFAAAYLPTSLAIVLGMATILAAWSSPATRWRVSYVRASRVSLPETVLVAGQREPRLCAGQPPGLRASSPLISCALLVMKTSCCSKNTPGLTPLTFARSLAFSVAWIGIRPRLSLRPRRDRLVVQPHLIRPASCPRPSREPVASSYWRGWRGPGSIRGSAYSSCSGARPDAALRRVQHRCGRVGFRGVPCEALLRRAAPIPDLGEFWAKALECRVLPVTAIAVYRSACCRSSARSRAPGRESPCPAYCREL